MGIVFNVRKVCPKCTVGLGTMQLRGNDSDVDLDDHESVALNYNIDEMQELHDRILADGDPFVCEDCHHRFHLDTPKRLETANRLFSMTSDDE